jgi:hypothetical protein
MLNLPTLGMYLGMSRCWITVCPDVASTILPNFFKKTYRDIHVNLTPSWVMSLHSQTGHLLHLVLKHLLQLRKPLDRSILDGIYLFIYPSIHPSIYLSIHPSIHLSIYLCEWCFLRSVQTSIKNKNERLHPAMFKCNKKLITDLRDDFPRNKMDIYGVSQRELHQVVQRGSSVLCTSSCHGPIQMRAVPKHAAVEAHWDDAEVSNKNHFGWDPTNIFL